MNPTRLLMSASALVLGLLGGVATFAPGELLVTLGTPASPAVQLMVQILGALYLGFAGLNWMLRESLVGGIYNRPVVIGNLVHFVSAALAIMKLLVHAPSEPMLWPLALLYAAGAVGFGIVLFRHPVPASPRVAQPDRA